MKQKENILVSCISHQGPAKDDLFAVAAVKQKDLDTSGVLPVPLIPHVRRQRNLFDFSYELGEQKHWKVQQTPLPRAEKGEGGPRGCGVCPDMCARVNHQRDIVGGSLLPTAFAPTVLEKQAIQRLAV